MRHLRFADLLTEASLPSPIDHQRRLAARLDTLLDDGLGPVVASAAGPLSLADVARTELFVSAARLSGWVDLFGWAAHDGPDGDRAACLRAVVARSPVDAELLAARRLAGAGATLGPGAVDTLVHRSRRAAYRARGLARRATRGAATVDADAPGERSDGDRSHRRDPSSGPGGARLIVVPWHVRHLTRWRPVLDDLVRRDGCRSLVVAVDERVLAASDAAGLEHRAVTWSAAAEVRHCLGARRALVTPTLDADAGPAARDDAALGLAARLVLPWLAARTVALADCLAAAHATDPAEVLIAANPYMAEGRTAALVARRLGIPVMSATHGSTLADDPRWARCPVDRIGAWGPSGAEALVSAGFDPAAVAVTGVLGVPAGPGAAPAGAGTADTTTTHPVGPGAGIRPARPDRPRVLVATSGPGDRVSLPQHLAFVDRLAAAVEAAPRLDWVVKLHPKDDPVHYRAAAFRHAELIPAGPEVAAIDAHLAEATVLVTVLSAAVLDAARCGVPVVVASVPGSRDHREVDMLRDIAVAVAGDGDDLADVVTAVADHPPPAPPAQVVDRYLAPVADPAAATAAEVRRLLDRRPGDAAGLTRP